EEKFINVFRKVTDSADARFDTVFDAQARRTPEGAQSFRTTVGNLIAAKTLEEWQGIYNQHGIPLTPVATPAEVRGDEHFTQRGMLVPTTDLNQNPTMYVPLPGTASADARHAPTAAPSPGQHSAEILASLGMREEEVYALKEKGIVD